MPITFVTKDLDKYSADILIDIVNYDVQQDVFSKYFDEQDPCYQKRVYKKDKDTSVPHELVLLNNKKFKKLIRIFNECDKKVVKEQADFDFPFSDILISHACRTIFISYEQYMNQFDENEFQIDDFIMNIEDTIDFYGLINVIVYIEENKLIKHLPKIRSFCGPDYVQYINNQIIIYDRYEFRKKEELLSRNDINNSEIERYMNNSARIKNFEDQLGEYILRTGYSEGTIANLAIIERSHINEVKNNLKKDSKKRKNLPREQLLSLAIVLDLNLEEFKDFMGAAGIKFPLENGTKEAKRDWVIMYFLENNIRKSVKEINSILYRLKLEPVGKKSKSENKE